MLLKVCDAKFIVDCVCTRLFDLAVVISECSSAANRVTDSATSSLTNRELLQRPASQPLSAKPPSLALC
jgi:hypothetical protein